MTFSMIGLIIVIIFLIPFIIYSVFKPINLPHETKSHNLIFTIITILSFIALSIVLCISGDNFAQLNFYNIWFICFCVASGLNSIFWVIYFICGLNYKNIIQFFVLFPIPQIFLSVCALSFLSICLQNLALWICTLFFTIGIAGNSLYLFYQISKLDLGSPKNKRQKLDKTEQKQKIKPKKIKHKVNDR